MAPESLVVLNYLGELDDGGQRASLNTKFALWEGVVIAPMLQIKNNWTMLT